MALTLIPRKVLFGNPDKAMPSLSPDGKRLAFLAPVDGVLNVWVGPADNPGAARPMTRDTVRGIRTYEWAYTNEHILFLQDKGGDENWRLYSVGVAGGEPLNLTQIDKVAVRIEQTSPRFPDEILVGLNDRDPQLHDVYRLNVITGRRELVCRNDAGLAGFVCDDDLQVRLATRMTSDGGAEILKPAPGGGWALLAQVAMEDSMTTAPIGLDRTGNTMFMADSRGRDTATLMAVDLATGASTCLAEDPRCDVGAVMQHPTLKHVQAVAFTYLRREWKILDPEVARDLDYLRTVADGEVEILSRALDDKQWVVAYLLDNGPVRYYRYDRPTRTARFLFTNRAELEGLPLSTMRPVVVRARDGRDLVCYYTLPFGSDSNGDGVPDRPLPAIMFIHGGPWGRDQWGFNPLHQLLSNRGYAVMSVNFRGSTGFGKAFLNAGNLEWGAAMHDDVVDAKRWLMSSGIAAEGKIAIMGGSYGGYATLVGLTFTPKEFTCGVDIVGPSNLVTLMAAVPPYWQPMIETFAKRMGDHRTEEGRAFLMSRSPISFVDRIERPLLIGQGANDPRVNVAESDQIVQAMQSKHIAVTYLLYPDEGHGFARPENWLSFMAVAEAFLSRCLGGRYQPVGDDFSGSSVQVKVGAEGVPGLVDAVR